MNAKKLTCGRRFWHRLHGLKIKVQKISPEWPFTSNTEHIFSDIYVAFGHGLPNKVLESAKKVSHGCRFWHRLHGLKKKLIKISPGWSFTSNREYIYWGAGVNSNDNT